MSRISAVFQAARAFVPPIIPWLVISGDDGANWYTGTSEADTISGGDGDDRLTGLAGHDLLLGGRHDDRLAGGAGDDTLDGGTGFDTGYWLYSPAGVVVDLAAGTATGEGADTLIGIEHATGS
ncbi:hypothetical protein, partial [Salipiger mucosus]